VQRGRPPRRTSGYCLYPYSFHSVEGSIDLFALARRLGVPTGKCDPKADPVTSWYSGPWNRLSDSVGERLITVQPEFWTLMGTSNPGRPFGARNKQTKPASKEAARVRRHRQKKIVTNIRA
jgi:hypothetical protein